eukprot:1531894-Heterocapsa_arctica.AAC.1
MAYDVMNGWHVADAAVFASAGSHHIAPVHRISVQVLFTSLECYPVKNYEGLNPGNAFRLPTR